MSRRAPSFLVAGSLLLALLGATPVAAGTPPGPTTRWVDDDGLAGPSTCGQLTLASSTIQSAVDASSDGDTILICPGDYAGQVTIDGVDNLTIRGVSRWTAHVLPASDHPLNTNLVEINGATGTTLQWLDFLAPTAGACTGIGAMISAVDAPETRIRANHMGIQGLDGIFGCGYARGMLVTGSPSSVIAWNRMVDFKASGVYVESSDGSLIRGNTIRFNHVTNSPGVVGPVTFGIAVEATDNVRVVRNVVGGPPTAGVSTPRLGQGISVNGGDAALIRLNRVFRVGSGMTSSSLTDSDYIANRVTGSAQVGMLLTAVSGGSTVTGNFVRSSGEQGIRVGGPQSGEMTQLSDNDFRLNTGLDCDDDTTGAGTSGTANTWTNNLGIDDDPDGICIDPAAP
ncbi:MAG TPA: right-handed parallel beta-helix repeat-containing protein [Candidatus Limnocylindrales bacterium]|nr:right-handed parallel beta-helix repeat-containing protein [Candidatus Limnocylindrales bacterium]